MRTDATQEQVRILAKLLKIPTFIQYPDLVRQMGSKADFGKILLALMKSEYEQRQENQNRRHQSELLFKVVADRSERGSIIVTTNLPFSEWTTLFENTAMVAAMVDRLTFQSHILDMNGKSYRLEQTRKQKR